MPCDFYLWRFIQDCGFLPPVPADLPDLRHRIARITSVTNSPMDSVTSGTPIKHLLACSVGQIKVTLENKVPNCKQTNKNTAKEKRLFINLLIADVENDYYSSSGNIVPWSASGRQIEAGITSERFCCSS
ncbi:hypothetical protein TNCV_943051 [Trichonephila clavipes]|nr:hypothetical protein TNCV_943051 [Trichonephila clavipes]